MLRQAGVESKYFILSNQHRWRLKIHINISPIRTNQSGFSFTHTVQPETVITGPLCCCPKPCQDTFEYSSDRWAAIILNARSCVPLQNRRLQSYWLVLCSDHSNNQADPHQRTLEWAPFTAETIWNILCLLSGVPILILHTTTIPTACFQNALNSEYH